MSSGSNLSSSNGVVNKKSDVWLIHPIVAVAVVKVVTVLASRKLIWNSVLDDNDKFRNNNLFNNHNNTSNNINNKIININNVLIKTFLRIIFHSNSFILDIFIYNELFLYNYIF